MALRSILLEPGKLPRPQGRSRRQAWTAAARRAIPGSTATPLVFDYDQRYQEDETRIVYQVRALVMSFDDERFVVITNEDESSFPGGVIQADDDIVQAADKYLLTQTNLLPVGGLLSTRAHATTTANGTVFTYDVLYALSKCGRSAPGGHSKGIDWCARHLGNRKELRFPDVASLKESHDERLFPDYVLLQGYLAMRHTIVGVRKILKRGENFNHRPTSASSHHAHRYVPTQEAQEILEFHGLLQATNRYSPVHVDGALLPGVGEIPVVRALLDSGAISANYMGMRFFKEHYAKLALFTRPTNQQVKLGDSVTHKRISYEVTLPVRFSDLQGAPHVFETTFLVFDTDMDIVFGLPTLLAEMRPIFVERFSATVADAVGSSRKDTHELSAATPGTFHRDFNQPTGPVPNKNEPAHLVKVLLVDSAAKAVLLRSSGGAKELLSWPECSISASSEQPQDITQAGVDTLKSLLGVTVSHGLRLDYTESRYDSDNKHFVCHPVLVEA